MTATDDLIGNAERHAESFGSGHLTSQPTLGVAVVTCMDSRIDPAALLGLGEGDAHVIRNAGGVISDEEIRSLSISQHLLGTREIMVIRHTDCGMLTFTDEDFSAKLEAEAGERPEWRARAFSDLEEGVRESLEIIRRSPFIPMKDSVRGFIYDVSSGALEEVGSGS
jgi:carbonic anhydrase